MNSGPSKGKIVLTVILIFFLLVSAVSAAYFIYRYKYELNKKTASINVNLVNTKATIPYLNVDGVLLVGKVGQKYKSEVFATLSGVNKGLTINADSLPDGLVLENCVQESNITLIPTPNVMEKCTIGGTPTKAGLYQTKISASGKSESGSFNSVENTVDLVIAGK